MHVKVENINAYNNALLSYSSRSR